MFKVNQQFVFQSSQVLAYLTVITLLSGFLFNRPLNNVGLLLAGFHAVWFLKDSWKQSKGVVLYSLLAVILLPTVFDLIFNDLSFLYGRNTMKWSLIVYPLFFMGCRRYPGFFRHVFYLSLGFFLFATLYSLVLYGINFKEVTENYEKAKVMSVLAYSDHIRMSWATVVSMIMAFFLYTTEKNQKLISFLIFYILFQFIYLHVLGSKTGLLTLYIATLIIVLGHVWVKNKVIALALLIGLMASPILAVRFIPTLKNRVDYIKYDFYHYSKNNYTIGLSDAIRVYSLEGGWHLFSNNPWSGVGFSKLDDAMFEWYKEYKPHVDSKQYFLPISEILLYAAAGGIWGLGVLLIFCLVSLIQFRKNIFSLAFIIPATFSFFYETHLENQTGIFVFGFFYGIFYVVSKEGNHQNLLFGKVKDVPVG